MQQINPYQPADLTAATRINRHVRFLRLLTAIGVLLFAIAAVLFFSADSTTIYTPYSWTELAKHSLEDKYFVVETPLQVKWSLGCAILSAALLLLAFLLRVADPHSWKRNSL